MLITSWGNISIHQCTGHDDHNHLRPDDNYCWTLKIPTWTFQNHHHLFELEPLRKVDPWCSSCPPHDRSLTGTFEKDNRWSWVKTERLYFAFSERMRNLVSVWPDSISSSAVTFASSHTLPSNLTALHLCTKIILCLSCAILFTHSYEVHILQDIASNRSKAEKLFCIPPTWSTIKLCSPQTRRMRHLCSCWE